MDNIEMAESKTVAIYSKDNAMHYIQDTLDNPQTVALELTVEDIDISDNRTSGNVQLYKITAYYDLTNPKE